MIRDRLIALYRILGLLTIMAALVSAVVLLDSRSASEDATFIFVGTAGDSDCSILYSAGSCVLIDTGEAQDAEHIAEVLDAQNIKRIDCMILTHPDQDHVGGASYLLDQFPVKQLVVPYYSGEKDIYTSLLEKANRMNIPVQFLYRSRLYTYGDLSLRLFAPEKFHYEKSNNYSLAVYVQHGQSTLFWAGDAQKERIEELLRLDLEPVQLYHVACHGRDTALSGQLIEMLKPEYAIVTANSPERETQALLAQYGTTVATTVGQDWTLISNGQDLRILQN